MDKIFDSKKIIELIKFNIPNLEIKQDEPMKYHSTFRTGGSADVFISPSSAEQILSLVTLLRENEVKYVVIGNGSNILVSDSGIDGVVICIGKNYANIVTEGEYITAMSGALLSKIASVALENSLTGFEFASGIPGSLGGAIYMNAGAYGGEMKDVTVLTEYISSNGEICKCNGEEHNFSYRHSRFLNGEIILSSKIKLIYGNREQIRLRMNELLQKRKEKQPLEYPSAGSTFKRPDGYFAAKLIDDCGLRGFSIGGAAVSDKHTGFVINKGNATTNDILQLIEHIQNTVKSQTGIDIEPEIKILGR